MPLWRPGSTTLFPASGGHEGHMRLVIPAREPVFIELRQWRKVSHHVEFEWLFTPPAVDAGPPDPEWDAFVARLTGVLDG